MVKAKSPLSEFFPRSRANGRNPVLRTPVTVRFTAVDIALLKRIQKKWGVKGATLTIRKALELAARA